LPVTFVLQVQVKKRMGSSPKRRPLLLAGTLAVAAVVSYRGGTTAALGEPAVQAQAGAPAASSNLLGTVTSTTADSVSITLSTGGEATIAITPQTRLLRTAPGEKTLKGAGLIHIEDLASGDRVLVLRVTPGVDASHYSAAAIVTMKQADIAQAHASEAEDWQRRGVGGIVKLIQTGASPAQDSPSPGTAAAPGATIMINSSQPGKTLAIHVTPATQIRRYAADSVNFADSRPATVAEIHPGDQLRARGDKSEDGAEMTAVEIVAGSFRNIAGTITAIDPAKSTVTVTDLATKKPVTLKLNAETQMRKLPPEMAQRLAARGGGAGGPGAAGSAPGSSGGSSGSGPASHPAGETASGMGHAPGEPGQTRAHGDPAAMLQHAPLVTLSELKKGDAIMVVASQGGGDGSNAATAITLIAGVEPLLEGSSRGASDNLFSASWNLSGGGGAEGASQ